MREEPQEGPQLLLSIEYINNGDYEDFWIITFKLCVKDGMREYSCRG